MTNSFTIDGSTVQMEVPGPKGAFLICLFDAEDLPAVDLAAGTWRAIWQETSKSYYIQYNNSTNGRHSHSWLHRLVMKAPAGLDVDHLRHNGLDNRKKNLEVRTRSQNLLNRKGPQSNSKTGILGVYKAVKKARPGEGRDREGYVGQLRANGTRYRSSVRKTGGEASAWYWSKRHELGIPNPGERTRERPSESKCGHQSTALIASRLVDDTKTVSVTEPRMAA